MKNGCIIFLLSIIISLTAVGLFGGGRYASSVESATAQSEYLRVHIRADSNDAEDQAVKYEVRDAVVDYLTPLVAGYETKAEAVRGISDKLGGIERVAESVLRANGFSYGASAKVCTEEFPTRIYGEYTLPAGEYTALIVALGSGAGDNWWCVVYPPLCFAAPKGENVVYKSKIAEIIAGFGK